MEHIPSVEPEMSVEVLRSLSPFRRIFLAALVALLEQPVTVEVLRKEQAAVNRSLQAAIDELERQQGHRDHRTN